MLRELKVYEATIRDNNIMLKIGRNVQDEVSSESYESCFSFIPLFCKQFCQIRLTKCVKVHFSNWEIQSFP